jgi:electron transport complex protein RnfB
MHPVTDNKTGWAAWSQDLADESKQRYELRQIRLIREEADNDQRLKRKAENKLKALDVESAHSDAEKTDIERKKAIIAAAIARAKAKQDTANQEEPND